jgi:hypothetical protein
MSKTRTIMRNGRAIEVEVHDPPAGSVLKPKWQKRYVQVPWRWVEKLRSAKQPSTINLAIALLYEHWIRGGRVIALSNKKAGWMSSRSKWRALAELEALDLIAVERKRGRSPRITCQGVKT